MFQVELEDMLEISSQATFAIALEQLKKEGMEEQEAIRFAHRVRMAYESGWRTAISNAAQVLMTMT